MDNIVIDVKGLSKQYNLNRKNSSNEVTYALKDVTFQVKRGERWGVIGKNGSGKSTLLKILSNIVKPTSGSAIIHGLLSHVLSVGDNFITDLSGEKNATIFFRQYGFTKQQVAEATKRAIEFAEIGQYFYMPIKTYSDGMYLRFAFATCLQISADILLLDEVSTVGDAAFQEKLKQHFRHQLTKAETMVMISHSPEEIMEYCSHCLWLEDGAIRMAGKAEEVETAYYYQLTKENWEKLHDRPQTKISSVLKTGSESKPAMSFIPFESEYLKVMGFFISAPEVENTITHESGILFSIDIEKRQRGWTIHPSIIIFNYMMNPILMLIANEHSEADNVIRSYENTIGRMRYSTLLSPRLLTSGNYYAEIAFTEGSASNKDFIEEAVKSPNKIHFEVKKGLINDYVGGTANIFIKPQCDWTIEMLR